MSFPDLIYNIAHDYPGKVPALAARMGKNTTVLQHKLDPKCSTHGINADEIERIVDFAGDNRRVAEYFASKAGAVVVDLVKAGGGDLELLDAYMKVPIEFGEFSAVFQKAWEDGRIDRREYELLVKESQDVIARLIEMRERIHQMVGR